MYSLGAYSQLPYADSHVGATQYGNSISDGVVAHSPLALLVTVMLSSVAAVTTPTTMKVAMHNGLTDACAAHTNLHVYFSALLSDTAATSGTATLTVQQIAALVDAALVSGSCTSVLAAKNAIVEMIFAADRLNRDWPNSVSDAAVLHDAMQSSLVTAVLIVDDALAQTVLTGHASIVMSLSDTVTVSNPLTHILAAHESIQDGVTAVLTFQLDGDVYTGIVLNTATKAASEYTEFPFNSLAEFNGEYIGAADDGLYVLDGNDDAGTPIKSYVRTGLIRVAEGKRARVPTAYFGYTATGDTVLKVVTTQLDGVKREDWYRLEKRTGDAPHSTRVKIGRGLSSVYWSFELHSISGFGLDTIQLFPMPLERRI